MKPLEEAKLLEAQVSRESRQATLDTIILNQINVLERLLETNAKDVQSPTSYNLCAGLLDQLKQHCQACFRTPEQNLEMDSHGYLKSSTPLFGSNL